MPTGNYFRFSVQIGEKCLQEYEVDSKQYISVDLHGSCSYVVEEAEPDGQDEQFQKYPVTPFKISIFKEYDYPCWFTIYMDGERVSSFPVTTQGRCSRIVEGHKCGNEIRELAFSLPRISDARTLTKARQEFAGTFRIICEEAIPHHMETVQVPRSIDTNCLPQTTTYPQLTKKDVSNVQGGMGVVCREGRTVKQLQYDNCSYRRRVRLTRGQVLEEILLHYRSKEVLQDLGVLSPDVEQEMTTKLTNVHIGAPPDKQSRVLSDKTNVQPKLDEVAMQKKNAVSDDGSSKAVKQEQIANHEMADVMTCNGEKDIKQEQINMVTSTPFRIIPAVKNFPQSPISIKHEQMIKDAEEANLIELKSEFAMHCDDDDDVVYIDTTYIKREPGENLDDSVIYMGDDSCYEVDIPEEEVSVMDLCEED